MENTTNNKAAPSHGTASTPRQNYNAIGRFLVRYSTLILDVLMLATAMFDGFMLGVHYG